MKWWARIKDAALKVFLPDRLIRTKYEAFKSLLEYDYLCHELLAQLETWYHERRPVDVQGVLSRYRVLHGALAAMIGRLQDMAPGRYGPLTERLREIDERLGPHRVVPRVADPSAPFCLPLQDIPAEHLLRWAGGKAAHLARARRELGLPVPSGFVATTRAFDAFLAVSDLRRTIDERLAELDVKDSRAVRETARFLVSQVAAAPLPAEMERALNACFGKVFGGRSDVPVFCRSSAVGEDEALSFAGQYESVPQVSRDRLPAAVRRVYAGKYAEKALVYRVTNGLADAETPMAVLVQEMIDARAGGVAYSRNPLQPDVEEIAIYAVWGQGDILVSGAVVPHVFTVSREKSQVVRRKSGRQASKHVVSAEGGLREEPLTAEEAGLPPIGENHALTLARWLLQLEELFEHPQDIEWCLDGEGNLRLLQSRPLQLRAWRPPACNPEVLEEAVETVLTGGETAASGVGSGPVVLIRSPEEVSEVPEGAVLVTPALHSRLAAIAGRLHGVVAETGSVAGHFASVAREWRIPVLLDVSGAMKSLAPGTVVTVDADRRKVYRGRVDALLDRECYSRHRLDDMPFWKRFRGLLDGISPLNLVDPGVADFSIQGCRTFHDLMRFVHEKALQEMFELGGARWGRFRGARKLAASIPLVVWVLDLDGGLEDETRASQVIEPGRVKNPAFRALWKGLSDPVVVWPEGLRPLDWNALDRVSGGIVDFESQTLNSFVAVSSDYLNLNFRFGYHFVVLDALCGETAERNYAALSFQGGGAGYRGRRFRVLFVRGVLSRYGFEATVQGDNLRARLQQVSRPQLLEVLETVGRLLGVTRLLDMEMETEEAVEAHVAAFLEREAAKAGKTP
ncbi:MAG: PEP/pyruvate-binding domain-containing protein [Thermodesulfobacteriota bacterium]|nr:PEP/pyruvate-binding domain-containing protein [Thermodesulfobacteriota bacterium]